MKYKINMLSQADSVEGQGVLSAYYEQVALVTEGLKDQYEVEINKLASADIYHYHTVNFRYYLSLPFAKYLGSAVGYIHFLPETVDTSLTLPKPIRHIFYKYLMHFYNSMDYLVTVNPYFIERLASYGIDPDKVTYIPNYVCDKQFHPLSPSEKLLAREKYNVKPDIFTVVCAGQLQRRKGIFDFVALAKKMPHVQFVWAGGFSFGAMTDGYKEIVEIQKNTPSNLIFTGIVPREEMNTIYNLGDVMFLPSYEELFPMTILEAMNCGVPILLRDIPIYENILFDFYLKEKDLDGFETALGRLATDADYYEQAVNRSQRGHAFYHKDHVLGMWESFYGMVIAKQEETMLDTLMRRVQAIRGNS